MKWSFRKKLFRVVLIIFIIAGAVSVYLYYNFNKLLSEALLKNFNSSINSDVYELSFEKLHVNFIAGNISVYDVLIKPREKPLNDYPYINSTLRLYTHKLELINIEIMSLLKENKFQLEQIEIDKPEIQLKITGELPIFFPILDSSEVKKKSDKRFVDLFSLKEFQLRNASIHIFNGFRQREFRISGFNISLNELLISQQPNSNMISMNQLQMMIGKFGGRMLKGPFRQISFENYKLKIDSFAFKKSIDSSYYKFVDCNLGFDSLNVNTVDSIFNLKLGTFNLSYKDKSIILKDIGYRPNIGQTELQKKFKFQNTQFEISVGQLNLVNMNFDSLIFGKKILIDEVLVDRIKATIFKNNAKILDKSKFPKYLGEMINNIPLPLKINRVKAMNADLVYLELKPDNNMAKTNINRMTALAENITNQSKENPLTISAEMFLENKVNVIANLGFSYEKPQFSLSAKLKKFNLVDLNPVIGAYTPAKIHKGTADEISFSGTVFNSYSTGTMKFLYHDLDIDLDIHNKAKWKSSVGAFAANAYINSSNPPSEDVPPRIVKYRAERMMNRGFINIIVKSALSGLKETIIMSKENRKTYKKEKKKMRDEQKK